MANVNATQDIPMRIVVYNTVLKIVMVTAVVLITLVVYVNLVSKVLDARQSNALRSAVATVNVYRVSVIVLQDLLVKRAPNLIAQMPVILVASVYKALVNANHRGAAKRVKNNSAQICAPVKPKVHATKKRLNVLAKKDGQETTVVKRRALKTATATVNVKRVVYVYAKTNGPANRVSFQRVLIRALDMVCVLATSANAIRNSKATIAPFANVQMHVVAMVNAWRKKTLSANVKQRHTHLRVKIVGGKHV